MKRVLILCTGNSCRSQMAQVIWNHLGQETWQAESAGSQPAGYVHPLAIEALAEIDLPTTGLASKSIDVFSDEEFDLAVTVCDHAKEVCPVLLGVRQNLHWPFEDPAEASGPDEAKMNCFRKVRDQIQQKIADFLGGEADGGNKVDAAVPNG